MPLAVRIQEIVISSPDFSLDTLCQRQYIFFMKKFPPRRTHSQPLQVRVAPKLYKLYKEAASASGLSLSAWARERLTQAARRELRSAGMVAGEVKSR